MLGARSEAILVFKNILVPLDGSSLAETALGSAARLAAAFKGRILLARVPNAEDDVSECREYLEARTNRLKEQGVAARGAVLDPGPAADRLLTYIDDDLVDLVVLTSHGRGGLARALWGSVADEVARGSAAPVMILGRHCRAVQQVVEVSKV